MLDELSFQLEAKAKTLLLAASVPEKFKEMDLYIWAINAQANRLIVSLDMSLNPTADADRIQCLLDYVLQELKIEVLVQVISIRDHCCYGNCKGCLNGSPAEQPVWIGRKF